MDEWVADVDRKKQADQAVCHKDWVRPFSDPDTHGNNSGSHREKAQKSIKNQLLGQGICDHTACTKYRRIGKPAVIMGIIGGLDDQFHNSGGERDHCILYMSGDGFRVRGAHLADQLLVDIDSAGQALI